MNNPESTCRTCKFWEPLGGENGECRRFPPAVVVFDTDVFAEGPTVDAEYWCGEWRAVEAAE